MTFEELVERSRKEAEVEITCLATLPEGWLVVLNCDNDIINVADQSILQHFIGAEFWNYANTVERLGLEQADTLEIEFAKTIGHEIDATWSEIDNVYYVPKEDA